MNEREMVDLLRRATEDLAPDTEALVAGGLQRGRRRQRRRRAATALCASAAAAVIGIGAWQLAVSDHVSTRGVDPAGTTPTSAPASVATSDPEPRRVARVDLAVTTADVPGVFASLAPGEVSPPGPKSGPDSAPVVDFTWNGFGVRVGITPDDYVSGRRVRDPAARCAEQSQDRCRPGPDGTVISASQGTSPAVDGGTTERSATVFRPDGWDVLVVAYNGPAKEGPVLADQPPFDLTELTRIASSDVWFR